MHCTHCGFVNGEDDHRCLRCGRRLSGVVVAAPAEYVGANALAPSLLVSDETQEFEPVQKSRPEQPLLFTSQAVTPNVIPFDRREREQQTTRQLQTAPVSPASAPARTKSRKPAAAPDTQEWLEFTPESSAGKPRKLKTDVEAQIFCDQPVATPTHRFVASTIDGVLILFGFGVLVGTYVGLGGSFGHGKNLLIGLAAAFVLVAMLYGLIWAIAGTETAGMRATDLQLITFDGFPVDARSRALRLASTWLSFFSGGLGLLWAMADEESLTWHDHISKTFPTIRESRGAFIRQPR